VEVEEGSGEDITDRCGSTPTTSKIKGGKVVGLNDLESLRAVFRVSNILGGDEEGREEGGGDCIYVCSLDLSYLSRSTEVPQR
jgi:hypothetical protein